MTNSTVFWRPWTSMFPDLLDDSSVGTFSGEPYKVNIYKSNCTSQGFSTSPSSLFPQKMHSVKRSIECFNLGIIIPVEKNNPLDFILCSSCDRLKKTNRRGSKAWVILMYTITMPTQPGNFDISSDPSNLNKATISRAILLQNSRQCYTTTQWCQILYHLLMLTKGYFHYELRDEESSLIWLPSKSLIGRTRF